MESQRSFPRWGTEHRIRTRTARHKAAQARVLHTLHSHSADTCCGYLNRHCGLGNAVSERWHERKFAKVYCLVTGGSAWIGMCCNAVSTEVRIASSPR